MDVFSQNVHSNRPHLNRRCSRNGSGQLAHSFSASPPAGHKYFGVTDAIQSSPRFLPVKVARRPLGGASEGYLPKQILIVDDSSALRRMVRCCVEEKTDWQVCGEAENGEVAVRLANELKPDLVLLDLAMPVMNGLEAARRISSVSPHPVMVMFTMQYSGQLIKEAEAAGITKVLSKTDVGIDHLLASMKTLLSEPPADVA